MYIYILFILTLIFIEQYCRYYNESLYEILNPNLFEIDFNEYKFPPTKNIDNYWAIVNKGYRFMKDTNIVVCGLCRNIEKTIDKLILRMNKISKYFKNFKIIIFENDSTDNTRNKLLLWAAVNKNVHVVDCPNNCKLGETEAIGHGIFGHNRMKKMSKYRNKLLKEMRKLYRNYDYCMMLDLDLRGPISINGIAHSFGMQNELNWDMISAYGLTGTTLSFGTLVYYDFIAYKVDDLDISKSKLDFIPIFLRTSFIDRGEIPIKVQSAFAGMAIYKISSIKDIEYGSPYDTCEHIVFHQKMISNGHDKIYMNPNMILLAGLQGDYKNNPFH